MADTKISALTAASAAAAANEYPINEAGTTKKVTGTQIATLLGISISTSITNPLVIGGTDTTSTLTLKTTTGVGTTNADMIFLVGNNGATEAMRILNSGLVGIGTAAPAAKLDVIGTIGLQIRASDTTADATQKNFYLTARNYTNAEEDVCVFITADTSTINVLGLGGGSGVLNAMTRVRIYTGAGINTLTGTAAFNIDENGFTALGKGTTAATTVLDVQGADNATAVTIRINATQANVTTADTFIDFRSTSGSEGSIAGTAGAGVLIFNTFTGSHWSQIDDKTDIEFGTLLEMVDGRIDWQPVDKIVTQSKVIGESETVDGIEVTTEKIVSKQVRIKETPSVKEHLAKSRICSTRASKNVYGAYGGVDQLERDLVLSLGTGVLFVANKGQDIEIGDYIMSSDVRGCGELQVDENGKPDGIYRNITVAKATQNVIWSPGEVSRKINVIYLGG